MTLSFLVGCFLESGAQARLGFWDMGCSFMESNMFSLVGRLVGWGIELVWQDAMINLKNLRA